MIIINYTRTKDAKALHLAKDTLYTFFYLTSYLIQSRETISLKEAKELQLVETKNHA